MVAITHPEKVPPVALAISVEAGRWPPLPALEELAEQAIGTCMDQLAARFEPGCELSIVFMDDHGIAELNSRWRGKSGPTNVLSFPAAQVPGQGMLGDIVLAFETVHREAELESRPLYHHILHLLVHGFLHICGYDHENEEDAERMEVLETRVLAAMDVPDPYA